MSGRNGSNACTFIALCFGKIFIHQNLCLPVNLDLSPWIVGLHDAIVEGNAAHDLLFENEAINLSIQEAVQMAGNEFGVQDLEQQFDFFGRSIENDLSEHIHRLALIKEAATVCQYCHT
ncbi:hypothetical protein OS493_009035 [Desmophyllum pertusum]|uniref:Uncharacterized protein n=1 Tax=Desmophyllum pertusum TaxID=174260 RepID=A0A9W9ZF37_9CNID|nr:hypothetical protein OS493_009035 [Desmophyllum pertusum]